MSDWMKERVKLGKTELKAGRLGIGASYGPPTAALEAAFEAGCNYFYWGALRRGQMAKAIRNIAARGKRDDLIVVIQDLRRSPIGIEKSLMRGLKKLGLDYADVLLVNWLNKPMKSVILETAENLRKKGTFRYLGVSTHNRKIVPELAKDPRIDLFHVRHNAANRGGEEDLFPHLPEDRPGIIAFNTNKRKALMNSGRIPADENRPTSGDCLRFALTNPNIDIAITGPSKAAQLEENIREVAKGPMTAEELDWMRRVGDYVYGRK
jgi:aryl-alcohol dehydrogenase-like predicted oxidoreductase